MRFPFFSPALRTTLLSSPGKAVDLSGADAPVGTPPFPSPGTPGEGRVGVGPARWGLSGQRRKTGAVILRYPEGSGPPVERRRSFGVPQDDIALLALSNGRIASPALVSIFSLILLLTTLPLRAAEPPFIFTDVSAPAGLKPHLDGALNHAVAWGDYNGDGLIDLFVGSFDKGPQHGREQAVPNLLFTQRPDHTFHLADMPSVQTHGRTSGSVLADLDNDGDLDLFVNNNRHPEQKRQRGPSTTAPSILFRNDGGRFVDVSAESALIAPDAAFGRDAGVFDYDGDGLLDLLILEDKVFRKAGRSRLYRNLGNMKFADVTAKAGLPEDLEGFGIAVVDLNDDGRPDFFIAGANRLYLSQPDGGYKEAETLRPLFALQPRNAEEIITGAAFGDIDNDGDMDLITGAHFTGPNMRVFLNEGLDENRIPRFRNITADLKLPSLPNKAPFCQIADFDNDGLPDLYWSIFLVDEKGARRPFICRGLGLIDGLPRFEIPPTDALDASQQRQNTVPPGRRGLLYYVNGPAIDYNNDGRLDLFGGIWPEYTSSLFRNDTPAGNWLQVRVEGNKMNRMGIGAKVRILAEGKLLAYDELTLNGGYSGTRPAMAHFGLGKREVVDVVVTFPTRREPVAIKGVKAGQRLVVREPE